MPTISNLNPITPRKRSTKAPKTSHTTAIEVTSLDPEVRARPKRRTFTAAYKRRVVEEAERMTPTERCAYLRHQGLYSSHLCGWRKLRDGGGSTPDRRGGSARRGRLPL